jgi:hypothetical protein
MIEVVAEFVGDTVELAAADSVPICGDADDAAVCV